MGLSSREVIHVILLFPSWYAAAAASARVSACSLVVRALVLRVPGRSGALCSSWLEAAICQSCILPAESDRRRRG